MAPVELIDQERGVFVSERTEDDWRYREPTDFWFALQALGLQSTYVETQKEEVEFLKAGNLLAEAIWNKNPEKSREVAATYFECAEAFEFAEHERYFQELHDGVEADLEYLITPDSYFDQAMNERVHLVRDPEVSVKEFAENLNCVPVLIRQVAAAVQLLRANFGKGIYRLLMTSPSQITRWTRPEEKKPTTPRKETLSIMVRRMRDLGISFTSDFGLLIEARAFNVVHSQENKQLMESVNQVVTKEAAEPDP